MKQAEDEKYRQRLLSKQRELAAEIARIESESEEAQVAGAEAADVGDRANRAYDQEARLQQLQQARSTLAEVLDAIARATRGSFGVCSDCGRRVEPKRLEAFPWARRCIACQQKQDSALL